MFLCSHFGWNRDVFFGVMRLTSLTPGCLVFFIVAIKDIEFSGASLIREATAVRDSEFEVLLDDGHSLTTFELKCLILHVATNRTS